MLPGVGKKLEYWSGGLLEIKEMAYWSNGVMEIKKWSNGVME
jgi:hypothetical protein